jgi:two-component system chemotaxis response regulator CheY
MKILVADDNEAFRLMLGSKLESLGHQVKLVDDGLAAAAELERENYSILLSDWLMPGLDGPSLCREIRSRAGLDYIYIILITSMCGQHDYRDGIAAGADDFINKPFDLEHLEARLHAAGRMLALHEELRDRALHDRLTGLLNRGAILDGLHQEMNRAAREGRGLAIFLVDVDHFKRVNDTYGHPAGDLVLKEAAKRMLISFRPYDRVGRYGGEEFLLVAPCCNTPHAEKLAERIRRVVAASPIAAGNDDIQVTVSVGVVATRADDSLDPGQLIAIADAALYRAKNSGRNRVEIVDYFPSVRNRRKLGAGW